MLGKRSIKEKKKNNFGVYNSVLKSILYKCMNINWFSYCKDFI